MKINTWLMAVIIIVVTLGGIGLSGALEVWNTQSSKVPVLYTDAEFNGEYNPADIRGSYTFGEISRLFNIPLDDLGKAFAIEEESQYSSFQCKNLESIYESSKTAGQEVGTASVRIFTALYKGLPIDLNDDAYFPKSVVEILKNKSSLSVEQIKYLESHILGFQG